MGVSYEEMKESKDDNNHRPDYVPGVIVEREIEGIWFSAEITHLQNNGREFTLRYLDDDNVEEGVLPEEIRLCRKVISIVDSSPKVERKSSLPKPLLGLIEDDSHTRQDHQAKVTFHNDNESGINKS